MGPVTVAGRDHPAEKLRQGAAKGKLLALLGEAQPNSCSNLRVRLEA